MYAFIAFFVLALGIVVSPAMAQQQPIRTARARPLRHAVPEQPVPRWSSRADNGCARPISGPLPAERPPAAGVEPGGKPSRLPHRATRSVSSVMPGAGHCRSRSGADRQGHRLLEQAQASPHLGSAPSPTPPPQWCCFPSNLTVLADEPLSGRPCTKNVRFPQRPFGISSNSKRSPSPVHSGNAYKETPGSAETKGPTLPIE